MQTSWWQFWNPSSGLCGGIIFGFVLIGIALIIRRFIFNIAVKKQKIT